MTSCRLYLCQVARRRTPETSALFTFLRQKGHTACDCTAVDTARCCSCRLLSSLTSAPPDGTSCSYPDETPVEDVEDNEGHREEDATASVDPLRDLLRGHRGEAGVVRVGAGRGHRNHQVSVARVIFGPYIRVSAHGVYGVHSERVAVALQQEVTTGGYSSN